MKKTIFILLIVCLVVPIGVFAKQEQKGKQEVEPILLDQTVTNMNNDNGNRAVQQGVHEPGTGLAEPTLYQDSGQGQQNQENAEEKPMGEIRRSRVANAVQEMLKIATRNGGIGQQIRTIAQNQNKNSEEAEEALKKARNRSSFARFFIGPNYKEIKKAKKKIEENTQNVEQLQTLKESLVSSYDKNLLDEQIEVMEEIKTELEADVEQNTKGFSLFGWLNKILTK